MTTTSFLAIKLAAFKLPEESTRLRILAYWNKLHASCTELKRVPQQWSSLIKNFSGKAIVSETHETSRDLPQSKHCICTHEGQEIEFNQIDKIIRRGKLIELQYNKESSYFINSAGRSFEVRNPEQISIEIPQLVVIVSDGNLLGAWIIDCRHISISISKSEEL